MGTGWGWEGKDSLCRGLANLPQKSYRPKLSSLTISLVKRRWALLDALKVPSPNSSFYRLAKVIEAMLFKKMDWKNIEIWWSPLIWYFYEKNALKLLIERDHHLNEFNVSFFFFLFVCSFVFVFCFLFFVFYLFLFLFLFSCFGCLPKDQIICFFFLFLFQTRTPVLLTMSWFFSSQIRSNLAILTNF